MNSQSEKYCFIDLFSGPGGLSLGLKASGFYEPVVAVESNPEAANTYRNNFHVEVVETEVERVAHNPRLLLGFSRKKGYKVIDAIVGGPPCRPFTTANTGRTKWERVREENRDENGEVEHPNWLSFWRIVRILRPRAVIAENVVGFRRYNDVLSKFIERLEILGYAVESEELNARFFGVPQNRERIFIVGIRDFSDANDPVLPCNTNRKNYEITTVKDAIGDLPELSNDFPGSSLSKYREGRPSSYQSMLRNGRSVLNDHISHSVHPAMAERFKYIPQGYSLRKAWKERKIPEAVMLSQYVSRNVRKGFSRNTLNNIHSNIYRRLKWHDVSCTITHVRKTVLIHPLQDRLISVREAARLQSFPDWFRFSGSISQQYQQIADAVPPFLSRAIACHVGRLLANKGDQRNRK